MNVNHERKGPWAANVRAYESRGFRRYWRETSFVQSTSFPALLYLYINHSYLYNPCGRLFAAFSLSTYKAARACTRRST